MNKETDQTFMSNIIIFDLFCPFVNRKMMRKFC